MTGLRVIDGGRPEPLEPRAPIGFRTQPHNIDAEQAVLGAILVNNETYRRIADFLLPEHFYEPVHGRIYRAIQRLVDAGFVADHVTLKVAFDDDDSLRELDGAQYLARMAMAAESIITAVDYARHLVDLACKRGAIHVGEELVNACYAGSIAMDWPEMVSKAKRGLEMIEREGSSCIGWMSMQDVATRIADQVEAPPRHISTGLTMLDMDLGGGFLTGRCYVFEGQGKSNKTGMLATIVKHQIERQVPIAYIMADRTIEEAIGRIIASYLKTNTRTFERGNDPGTAEKIRALQFPDNLMLAQEPALTFSRLKMLATHAAETGAKGIILDYFQRVGGDHEGERVETEASGYERVADFIKAHAIRHDCFWVVASQENDSGQTLGTRALQRASVWLARMRKVVIERLSGLQTGVWLEIPYRTHGSAPTIGDPECPPWVIDDSGPLLEPFIPTSGDLFRTSDGDDAKPKRKGKKT